jgi:streptogrisin C
VAQHPSHLGGSVRRKVLATCVALAAVALGTGVTPASHATTAEAPAPTPPEVPEIPPEVPEIGAMINAYLRDDPGLTYEQAERAVLGQESRIRFLERLQAENPGGFGGSWYEPKTNTQHVNTVGAAAASQTEAVGAELGLTLVVHPVDHSLGTLEAIAAEINAGRHPTLGAAGVDRARPDPVNSQVTVGLPADELARFPAGQTLAWPIVLQAAEPKPSPVPSVCTDRLHCGRPLRSGIVLWASGRGNQCSLGFTARATDGSRWAVTAGHCGANNGGQGVIWGHGEQYIGPIRHGRNSGNIDVARILVQNPYWTTGGWFFNAYDPNTPVPVDYAIAERGTIQKGDAVCLSAWHSRIGENCAMIYLEYGDRGMPQVNYGSCPGDSGGGWYHITASGYRIAYGIHHGGSTTPNCSGTEGGDSIFTAIPDLNAWWDDTTTALLRVEYR